MPETGSRPAGIHGTLRLYPRGFLGKVLPPRLVMKPRPFDVRIRTTPLAGIVVPQQNTADPNAAVEMLYGQTLRRAAATMAFEFREKVLVAALDAFGTASFSDWVASQAESPSFGDTHQRFLDDTLHFIMHGRRNLSLESWASFLLPVDTGSWPVQGVEAAEGSEVAQAFFSFMQAVPRPAGSLPGVLSSVQQTVLVADVIQQWTSRPGGFEDLLGTLHLLFGNL